MHPATILTSSYLLSLKKLGPMPSAPSHDSNFVLLIVTHVLNSQNFLLIDTHVLNSVQDFHTYWLTCIKFSELSYLLFITSQNFPLIDTHVLASQNLPLISKNFPSSSISATPYPNEPTYTQSKKILGPMLSAPSHHSLLIEKKTCAGLAQRPFLGLLQDLSDSYFNKT